MKKIKIKLWERDKLKRKLNRLKKAKKRTQIKIIKSLFQFQLEEIEEEGERNNVITEVIKTLKRSKHIVIKETILKAFAEIKLGEKFEDVVKAILDGMKSWDSALKMEGIKTFEKIGENEGKRIEKYIKDFSILFRDSDWRIRVRACAAISEIGKKDPWIVKDASLDIINILQSGHKRLSIEAGETLKGLASGYFGRDDFDSKSEGIGFLRLIAETHPELVEEMKEDLLKLFEESENKKFYDNAGFVLTQLGGVKNPLFKGKYFESVLPIFFGYLEREDRYLREVSFEMLNLLAEGREDFLYKLIPLIENGLREGWDENFRRKVIEFTASLSVDFPKIIPKLVSILLRSLEDDDVRIRKRVKEVLSQIGKKALISYLRPIFSLRIHSEDLPLFNEPITLECELENIGTRGAAGIEITFSGGLNEEKRMPLSILDVKEKYSFKVEVALITKELCPIRVELLFKDGIFYYFSSNIFWIHIMGEMEVVEEKHPLSEDEENYPVGMFEIIFDNFEEIVLEKMRRCGFCGEKTLENGNFCANCGERLKKEKQGEEKE